jgi:glycolate oxidase FAD binding subunit
MPRPTTTEELIEVVRAGGPLEIRGGGSKQAVGAPREAAVLDMGAFAGVIDYDPPELVLTAGAATPLAEIEALVAAQGQQLAFEPFDHGPLFGRPAGQATLGGVIAAGVSGSRRATAGAARDHLLGFKAVSGRGEAFVAGARVVKNVTGYDLPKLAAGSWGRLFAMTEVTVKVVPRGRERRTLALRGLDPRGMQRALSKALGSPADVQAAAALPAGAFNAETVAAVRLEGFGPSVAARAAMVQALWGGGDILAMDDAERLWSGMTALPSLSDAPALWRINLPPTSGPELVAAMGAPWLADWGFGLVWLGYDGDPAMLRSKAEALGGHAQLVRGPENLRAMVPALHPQVPGVARLEARVRAAFDPLGVFETGRFLDVAHAD